MRLGESFAAGTAGALLVLSAFVASGQPLVAHPAASAFAATPRPGR
jgi:hypothetical protein